MKSKNLKFNFFVLALFTAQCLSAQELVFEKAKEETSSYPIEIPGTGKELFLRSGSYNFTISKMDLKTIRTEFTSKEINILDKKKKDYFFSGLNKDTICLVNDRFQHIADTWSKLLKKKTIYFRTIGKDGTANPEVKELFSLDCNGDRDNGNSIYSVKYSADQSTFGIIVEDVDKTTFLIFNSKSAEQISSRELKCTNSGKRVPVSLLELDNEGNAIVTFNVLEKESSIPYTGMIKKGETVMTDIKAEGLDKTKNRYSIVEKRTDDGKLIQSGMYHSLSGSGVTDGTFYSVTDCKTGKVAVETYSPLNDNVYSKLNYKIKSGKREEAGYENFRARQLVSLNGSNYMVSEHTFSRIGENGLYYTLSMEVLVSKYNADGKNEWQVVIPKNNLSDFSPTNSSGSYQLVVGSSSLSILFLDHPDMDKININNYKMDDYKVFKKAYDANVVCVTITEKGEASKKLLFQNPEKGFVFLPENMKIKRDNVYLILYKSVDKKSFGTITVK